MRTFVLLALVVSGCTGVGLERLQEEIDALRQRVQAREEVRIHVASAEPVTKASQRASPDEPHLTVAVPPCPPAVVRGVERPRRAPARPARATRGKGRR